MHAWRTLTIRKGDAVQQAIQCSGCVVGERRRLACTADRELIIIRICFLLGENGVVVWCAHPQSGGTQVGSARPDLSHACMAGRGASLYLQLCTAQGCAGPNLRSRYGTVRTGAGRVAQLGTRVVCGRI